MRRPARTISLSSRKWWNDAQSASFHHPPGARSATRGSRASGASGGPQDNQDCRMCEECEEIEPLTVAYFGKADRKGWRPPATAKSVPIHDDSDMNARLLNERVVSGRPYAI